MTEVRTHNKYTIGWVCALSVERTAATAMLDERHMDLPRRPNDLNTYTLGSIGGHNIVIACLPEGTIGTTSAATVVKDMVYTFPAIRVGLMVGIGGGVPPTARLGDVVVSVPDAQYPGVVQWDMGKAEQGGKFRRTGALNKPPTLLLTAVTKLKTDHKLEGSKIAQYLDDIQTRYPHSTAKFLRSDSLQDVLFKASYEHVDKQDRDAAEDEEGKDWEEQESDNEAKDACKHCDKAQIVKRKPQDMRVHYGLIASGNQVIKDAQLRDRLSKGLGKVLCVEMEAAGLMDNFPCIVIRGICDYADSHKNKAWQEHAAAVAAAFAKELLGYVEPQETRLVMERAEDLKVLNWLTLIDYGPQHSDYLQRRQPGTGQWLLDCETYKRWVADPGQTLFCPGIPGAGKTILTSIVVDNLEDRFVTDPTIIVAYIYCKFNRKEEQKLEDLMSSLLKQLAGNSPSLPPVLKELYERHALKRTKPTLEEISTALRTVVATFARVFIIVDALDECQVADNCRTRFVHQLLRLQTQQGISVFATTRRMPDIEKELSNSSIIEIRASEEDIGRYLKSAIACLPRFIADRSDLQDEITQTISRVVDGMFLLAQLYFNTLLDKDNPKNLRKALQDLTTGSRSSEAAYNSAYDDTMLRIEGQLKGQAARAKEVMMWITCAKRPLTKTELQHALAVEIGEAKLDEDNMTHVQDLVSVCAGLVTIDEESNVVRLVHYTAQEYFENTQGRWFPSAHLTLTATCTTYLSFEAFAGGRCQNDEELEKRLEQHRLYQYAARHWGDHARVARSCEQIVGFLQKTAHINASAQSYFADRGWHLGGPPNYIEATHLAAIFGLEDALFAVWNLENRDARDSNGRTPLSWAAENGHTKVVKLLLETKEVEVNSKDTEYGRTPLSWAAKNGHYEVVELLLETEQVEVDSKDNYGQTPLSWATENGHYEMVKLLLETKEVEVNSKDTEYGQTPLSWVAGNGYIKVVKLLLETKEVEAAKNGHYEVVELLLETEQVEVDSKNNYNQTPLSWAAENGHTKVVKLLLETKEVEVNSKDNYGQTPLSWAAENGHYEVVKLLLETKEVEVDSKDTEYGRTPLSWVAGNGHAEVVKLLLETKEVEVDSKDTEYSQTPLLWAAENGHAEVVKLLLETKEVEVDSKDTKYSRTPLLWAAKNGHTEVVKLLLETEQVEIDSKDIYNRTPLSWAAENGHAEVVRLLLETEQVEVDSKDNDGRTPI
ncbi:hypothetical protein JX265_010370 [Neoarthrinium moseri]|uniref:Nucleoside phosphorylase domain-containing protein n=1 Tax=Neoarthrinium moseri TaxID=1658444 RepID=A0A9P9WEB4_9PEZI|nr:hypothetical protein JX265_010370 [Neoarthrinium moseri]